MAVSWEKIKRRERADLMGEGIVKYVWWCDGGLSVLLIGSYDVT
jgi:hypothetical protein